MIMLEACCWGVWVLAGVLTALVYAVVSPGSAWCGVFAVSVGLLVYVGENWELHRELTRKEERARDLLNDLEIVKRSLMTLTHERHAYELEVRRLESKLNFGRSESLGSARDIKHKMRRGLTGKSCSSL
jgi:hypothetical protein